MKTIDASKYVRERIAQNKKHTSTIPVPYGTILQTISGPTYLIESVYIAADNTMYATVQGGFQTQQITSKCTIQVLE